MLIPLQDLIFLLDNSTSVYLVFVILILFLCIIIAIRNQNFVRILKGYSSLRLFFSLYILLILFSGFYFFENNLFRWFIGLTPFVLTIPFLNISYSSNSQINAYSIRKVWSGIAWGSLIVLVFVFVNGFVERGRLNYLTITPSTIGRNSVIIVLFASSQLLDKQMKNKNIYILMFVLGLIFLMLSVSKSSIAALIIIMAFLILKLRLFSIRFTVLVFIILIGLTLTPYFDNLLEFLSVYQSSDQLVTLTGRTYIWENIIPLIEQKLWFGYGYNSPSLLLTYDYFDILYGRNIIQAHNALLQSMLNLGIVGTLVLFLLIILFFRSMRKIFFINKNVYTIILPVFLFLIIRGLTEASFANGYTVDVFLFSICVYQIILYKLSLGKFNSNKVY